MVRVYELAKEFGVESKAVMAKLQEMGEFVRSASSTIEAPVVRRLKDEFGSQGPKAQGRRPQGQGAPAPGRPADGNGGRAVPRPGPARPRPGLVPPGLLAAVARGPARVRVTTLTPPSRPAWARLRVALRPVRVSPGRAAPVPRRLVRVARVPAARVRRARATRDGPAQ